MTNDETDEIRLIILKELTEIFSLHASRAKFDGTAGSNRKLAEAIEHKYESVKVSVEAARQRNKEAKDIDDKIKPAS